MASTYTLISSNVLSSSAASVTFSSIPSTYTDLVLRISARTDRVTNRTSIILIPNNDTDKTSITFLRGDGASASSGAYTVPGGIDLLVGAVNGANQTANSFDSAEIYIPNYAGSTKKPISSFNVSEQNAASTDVQISAVAGLYTQTTAISSLFIKPIDSVNFVLGSSFYLYGIKNS